MLLPYSFGYNMAVSLHNPKNQDLSNKMALDLFYLDLLYIGSKFLGSFWKGISHLKAEFHKTDLDTVELQWLEHCWLIYHGCFEFVLKSLGKNLIAADLR